MVQVSDYHFHDPNRILAWIETIDSTSQEALGRGHSDDEPCRGRLKRKYDQHSNTIPRKRCVLKSTSGSIMTSRYDREEASDGRRRSLFSRTTPQREARIQCDQDADELALVEETPRPLHGTSESNAAISANSTFPFHSHIPAETESYPSRSSTNTSLNRSTSPVITIADLRLAQKPTLHETLKGQTAREAGGVLSEYQRLNKISQGIGVIPYSIKKTIETRLDREEWPSPYAYEELSAIADPKAEEYNQVICEAAFLIHSKAGECEMESCSEAEWNSRVHAPLFNLIEEHPKHKGAVKYFNITTARIKPKRLLSTVHTNGVKMEGKMVDYAFCLQPDETMNEHIREILQTQGNDSQSINQTAYAPLRFRPIFLNIETKLPFTGGEESGAQLAIWVAAGLQRTQLLLDEFGNLGAQIPTVPMLSIHGHDMHLSAFKPEKSKNVVYGKLRVGSTDSLLGIFQMIKGIGVLIEWANTKYRSWITDNALRHNLATFG